MRPNATSKAFTFETCACGDSLDEYTVVKRKRADFFKMADNS